jgi:hypothetical protein
MLIDTPRRLLIRCNIAFPTHPSPCYGYATSRALTPLKRGINTILNIFYCVLCGFPSREGWRKIALAICVLGVLETYNL